MNETGGVSWSDTSFREGSKLDAVKLIQERGVTVA
jgi:hypothetical protein